MVPFTTGWAIYNSGLQLECARCSDASPLDYDSGRHPIHFCLPCRTALIRNALIEGIRYCGSYEFTATVIYADRYQIKKILYHPMIRLSGTPVQATAFLLPRRALPVEARNADQIGWTLSRFLEEVYSVEWARRHLVESMRESWFSPAGRLF